MVWKASGNLRLLSEYYICDTDLDTNNMEGSETAAETINVPGAKRKFWQDCSNGAR